MVSITKEGQSLLKTSLKDWLQFIPDKKYVASDKLR